MDNNTGKRRREGFCDLCSPTFDARIYFAQFTCKQQHQQKATTATMTAITTTIAAVSSSSSTTTLLSSSPSIGNNLHDESGVMLTVFGYLDTRSLFRVSLVRKDWNWTKMDGIRWTILANSMVKVPTTTEPGTRRRKENILYEGPASDKQYIKDQLNLKKRLRHGFLSNITEECWCLIWFRPGCNPSTTQPRLEVDGMLARITAINGEYYAFSNVRPTMTLDRPEIILVHSNQFAVEWVNNGHDAVGARVNGTELEHEFRTRNTAFWTGAMLGDDDDDDDDDDNDNDNDDDNDDDDNDDDDDDDDDDSDDDDDDDDDDDGDDDDDDNDNGDGDDNSLVENISGTIEIELDGRTTTMMMMMIAMTMIMTTMMTIPLP